MALVLRAQQGHKNAYTALIAAQYSGVEVEHVNEFEMGVSDKTHLFHNALVFIDRNRFGKVPLLETPEGPIVESNAMARYVAKVKGDDTLCGSSPGDFVQIEQWIAFANKDIDEVLIRWVYLRSGIYPYNSLCEHIFIGCVRRALDILNSSLAPGYEYLVGDCITLADIVMTCNLHFGFTNVMAKSFTSEFPHVERYFWNLVGQKEFKKFLGEVKQADPLPKVGRPRKLVLRRDLTRAVKKWRANQMIKEEGVDNQMIKEEGVDNQMIKEEGVDNQMMEAQKEEGVDNQMIKEEGMDNLMIKEEGVVNLLMDLQEEWVDNLMMELQKEGVDNLMIKEEGVDNLMIKEEGVDNLMAEAQKEEGVGNLMMEAQKEEGVDNLMIKEEGVDNLMIKEEGVDNLMIKEEGVDNLMIKEEGVDNLMIKEEGVDNLMIKEEGVDNLMMEAQKEGVDNLVLRAGELDKREADKTLITAEYCGVKVVIVRPAEKYSVLVTGDGPVFDNSSMPRYIAKLKGDLYPSSVYEYAQVEEWMEFAATEIEEGIKKWIYPRAGLGQYDPHNWMGMRMDGVQRSLRVLDTHLAANINYLVGNRITLADIAMTCALHFGFTLAMTKSFTSEFPHVERYFWNLVGRKEFKKFLGEFKQAESLPEWPVQLSMLDRKYVDLEPIIEARKKQRADEVMEARKKKKIDEQSGSVTPMMMMMMREARKVVEQWERVNQTIQMGAVAL